MSVNLRKPRNYYCQQTRSLLRQQAGLFLIASKRAYEVKQITVVE